MFFFFKQKTAYEMRISDWSSDVCSSDLLGLFIDESQVALLEAQMAQKGFLTARQMAATFQMLRSYDLLWSRMVGEYLLGTRPPMTLSHWPMPLSTVVISAGMVPSEIGRAHV